MRCLVAFSRAKLSLPLLAGYKLYFNTSYGCQQLLVGMWVYMKLTQTWSEGIRIPPELKRVLLRLLNLCQDAGPHPAKFLNYHKSTGRLSGFSHDSTFHDSQVAKRSSFSRAGVLPTTTLNGGTLRAPDGFSQSALSDCITDCWSSRQGIIALKLLCPKWGQ